MEFPPFGEGGTCPDELGWTKEAADVVHTKGWGGTGRHTLVDHEVRGQVKSKVAITASCSKVRGRWVYLPPKGPEHRRRISAT